ncbi:hypothetical protein STFR1_30168 [Bacillus vallismortis]
MIYFTDNGYVVVERNCECTQLLVLNQLEAYFKKESAEDIVCKSK